MVDVSERLGRFGETDLSTLCSKCPFFQLASRIRRKNARKRCRIEPQRPLRFYKVTTFQKRAHYTVVEFWMPFLDPSCLCHSYSESLQEKRSWGHSCNKFKCAQKLLFSCCDYLSVVIVLSMGSAKKKPMTKKEREEKRRKHKEKRLKK